MNNAKKIGRAHVGTSGWAYIEWYNFYARTLPTSKYLEFYADQFDTVEIASTFTRLPRSTSFHNWSMSVPETFSFSLRVSKKITHDKKFEDIYSDLRRFLISAKFLGSKLNLLLVSMDVAHVDIQRFENFIHAFEKVKKELDIHWEIRLAFELLNARWYKKFVREDVKKFFEKYRAAWVLSDPGQKVHLKDPIITTDFIYVRFASPKTFFADRYGEILLEPWRDKILSWLKQGIDVYAYFNNDYRGYAAQDALMLKKMLKEK